MGDPIMGSVSSGSQEGCGIGDAGTDAGGGACRNVAAGDEVAGRVPVAVGATGGATGDRGEAAGGILEIWS